MDPLPLSVIHYSAHDPRTTVGGVERFARNLERIFAEVRYLTPASAGRAEAAASRLPIICDNQLVVDWPAGRPVIGFQHGVAAVKLAATRSLGHWRLARAQRKAARRPGTLWVACAEWVSAEFARRYGNRARHVIYYPADVERFDARLANRGSRLILHDARTVHKGSRLIPDLARAFPAWRFEPLACPPEQVPDRMRGAAAFLHLSRYEGNSLVCGEAMAMDLPCCLSRVGLMRDPHAPQDVFVVEAELLRGPRAPLIEAVGSFLASLGTRVYHPRAWVLDHATIPIAREGWRRVMLDFQQMSGWDLGL